MGTYSIGRRLKMRLIEDEGGLVLVVDIGGELCILLF